ncbi:sugar phosphate isomerase/epimerase [Paenibacillus sp. XY044]|uniref:sugar phosphate isomerase/epimerase family protein n=1 Tax=Paenibacillus sp. XY044 TaxID=2026089 RepID=UPI0015C65CD9|nr:sugar phosphate isomerase/epimerase family protein [Paenibacillus sp. XY044]
MFPFKLSLNTSTLLPYGLDVKEQVSVAAEAGYEGIELWVRDIEAYLAKGGNLQELRRYIEDHGLKVANAIAFWAWADRDPEARKRGFDQAEKEMEMLAELGCLAAAAPPFGQVADVTLDDFAASFAKLAELARRIGIEPYLEFWGKAARLNGLKDAIYVAQASGVAEAKILIDPFHMYTGGSELQDLDGLSGSRIGIVHVNDYPAAPARSEIQDAQRVFPGDGIAPSGALARTLADAGYEGYLSLELFMDSYGGATALETAKLGIAKIREAYGL